MKKRIEGTWPLGVAWMFVLVLVVLLGWSNVLESTKFYGIADTREILINSKNPVEIKKIHVVEGESVIHGQLLLELRNPEMTLKINQISHQLDRLKAQKDVDKTELKSEIAQLEAKKNAQITETNYRIQELENVYAINTSLKSGLKSVTENEDTLKNTNHPILLKIDRLKQELESAINLLDIQIDLKKEALAAADKPVGIRINQLEKELVMLKRENSQLNIFASISGVIGSVNYKVGEKVTPFAPIITLHPKTPSIIKGYIRENEYSMISVGDKLSIISQADARNQVKGSVIGVGARIVEYPERLRKRPELMAWGREITVKIPADNNLILGEKVMICLEGKNKSLWNVLRDAIFPQDTIAGPPKTEVHLSTDISEVSYSTVLPVIPLDDSSIEASAMVYLPNKDEYLLASDETPKKRLILYLMDDSGQITKEYPIDGIDKIDDIESMTCDEQGTIYIAASMSAKGNGKMPKNRRLLVTIKQDDSGFYLYKSVDLFDLLEECAEENKNKQWAKYLLNGIDNEQTDVEGIFWDDNALFLGFKAPFFMDRSVILKISQIDQLLENKELTASQISIWKMLSLKGNNFNKQESISDLFYHDGNLFITGVPLLQHEKERSGSLWQLDLNANQLTHLIQFKDLQPEGIAAAKNVDSLLICFDQGSHYQSQITLIKGLQ